MINLTSDERNQLEQGIYLPMILSLLERNKKLAQSHFKINEPFVALFDKISKDVQSKLHEVQRFMKKHRMKVYEVERDDLFTIYSFQVRGYEEKHSYFNFHMRNEVQKQLTKFLLEREQVG
ncbi:MAG: hypothetical protein K0R18_3031 [Bacillales bacterium]|jgi:hypothetical protein|nr:hypothetical protein [Bacillales bacterium]